MKATVLVDNIGSGELKGEWGLCIYIEYNDKKILLDAGASALYLENADKLRIPLDEIDYAILSHAHSDHANGMDSFFRHNHKAKFFLRDACGENCYKRLWLFKKYIGLPKGMLSKWEDRITFVSGDFAIEEGISLIPHKTPGLAAAGKRESMYIQGKKGGWMPDDFSHEQSLVFDTPKGMVIFNSCSHGGAGHIIREVADTFPDKKVLALIGGFHLFNKSQEEVRSLAAQIRQTGIQTVYTGHCTGEKAFEILTEELGQMVRPLRTGLVMEF